MKIKGNKELVNTVFITETQKHEGGLNSHEISFDASVINTTYRLEKRRINKINYIVEAKYLELKAEHHKMV